MIQAKAIADSTSKFGNRITTVVATMPKFILAELNTHRMFSRNSASSRAIRFENLLKSVKKNPFIPIAWQKDHSGMQGTEYFESDFAFKSWWLGAKDDAIHRAKELSQRGLTKQLCNRILEPFMWHTVIITATEWENFFALRCPKYEMELLGVKSYHRSKKDFNAKFKAKVVGGIDAPADDQRWFTINKGQAEIHMMALAEAIWDALNESTPRLLEDGYWHVPFGGDIIKNEEQEKQVSKFGEHWAIKVATARCARVSYTVAGTDGKVHDYEKDIEMHDRLLKSGHMSAFEHCARCTQPGLLGNDGWSGNFYGWEQYRKTIEGENIFKG